MSKKQNFNHSFDYVIIGSGLAGLQVALAMQADSFFDTKKIIIIDQSSKNSNDKTFSFWEKSSSQWDQITYKTWGKTYFHTNSKCLEIPLTPYLYKSIKAIDFYKYCLNKLKNKPQFYFITDTVVSVKEKKNSVLVTTNGNQFSGKHVFDSRISDNFNHKKNKYPLVSQSFKGWEIKTSSPIFNSNFFTMMDYRLRWKNSTSFMYILPKSDTEALLEYTFFAPFILSEKDFDLQLKLYLKQHFPQIKYTITATEKGVIPMTAYPFKDDHSTCITKIGTAGGWVKASTGYSFKFAEKNAKAITLQLKKNQHPTGYKSAKRFHFYDRLFLKILQNQNTKGVLIFEKMYQNITPDIFFRFLDEETNIWEEIKLISKLPYIPFLKALFFK